MVGWYFNKILLAFRVYKQTDVKVITYQNLSELQGQNNVTDQFSFNSIVFLSSSFSSIFFLGDLSHYAHTC